MPGAGTRVMIKWIEWFVKKGHHVSVACPANGWLTETLSKSVPVIHANFDSPDIKNLARFSFNIIKLCVHVLTNRIDIIHCNSDACYYVACTVAKITRKPIIAQFHFHYELKFYQWLFKSWRSPDMVILVSNSFFEEDFPKINSVIPEVPVRVLYNCIDSNDYGSIDNCLVWKNKNVIYPAAIAPLKQNHQLYWVDKLIRLNGADLSFSIIGKVNNFNYENIMKSEEESNFGNRISRIGHVDNIAEYYHKAFLSVSLSTYETFGYSVLESMAMGIPVIAYNVPAIKEVLGDGGVICEQGDYLAMAKEILHISKNYELWCEMSEKARSRAEEKFSVEVICSELHEFYKEIIV
jgi:glycosyltransferase involved in cell wall biosynthesis